MIETAVILLTVRSTTSIFHVKQNQREPKAKKHFISNQFFCLLETGKTPLYCLVVNKYFIG